MHKRATKAVTMLIAFGSLFLRGTELSGKLQKSSDKNPDMFKNCPENVQDMSWTVSAHVQEMSKKMSRKFPENLQEMSRIIG